MAITLATGTTIAIGSTYGASKTMTSPTNTNPAVVTLEASHNVAVGDFVEVTSGWARLNGRILKATAVATNDVTFGGFDASSTTRYPNGTGSGGVREITAFTTIGQITRDIEFSGGEQQYEDVTTLDDVIEQEIPTTRRPISVGLPLFFDNSLSYVPYVRSAAETATPTAVKFTYPSGAVLVANAYWSYQEVPTIQGQTLRGRIDLRFRALPAIY